MERKIGEKFSYEGTLLEVVEKCGCLDCFFSDSCCNRNDNMTGSCSKAMRHDKTGIIFKKVKEDKTMTKSDLKPGMVVELKDGDRFLVLNENLAVGLYNNYLRLNYHDENLVCGVHESTTIVKVYNTDKAENAGFADMLISKIGLTLLWERTKEVILTMEQIAEKFNVNVNQLKIKK